MRIRIKYPSNSSGIESARSARRNHAACRTFPLLIISILFTLTSSPLDAQEYNFRNLSVTDGLAQSQVYAMCEDRRGNIWFGTRGGGVSRFDGMEFTTITEEDGLVNNYVRAIMEDRSGAIWIGTDRGASRYDGKEITSVLRTKEGSGPTINAIVQDSSGAIWLGTEGEGLYRLSKGALTLFGRSEGLPSMFARALYVDREGRLWIGTNNGAAVYDGKRFTIYRTEQGLAMNIISAITQDRSGRYWFATYGGGASIFDGRAFTRLTTDDGLSNNTLLSILSDRDGRIWLGTAGGGASRFDGGGMRVFTEMEGLCNNVITALLQDSEGNIWLGSSGGGISRFDSERFVRFTERQGKLGNWVYAIRQDRSGAIWFGSSSGGVTVYDGTLYRRFSEKDGFTAGKVKCIHVDRTGRIWLGTVGNGAFLYDGSSFRHLGRTEGMRGAFINGFAEDRQGNIWVASSDAGLICYAPQRRDSTPRFRYFNEKNGLGTPRVYDVLCDARGTIWAATDGAGIGEIVYDPVSGPTVRRRHTSAGGAHLGTIRSIAADSLGNVLFGTGGSGLAIYDGARFHMVRKRSGASSDNIYAIVVDRSNQIWLGTEKGIDRIALDSAWRIRAMKHFGKAEGVIGVETTQNGACIDREGNVWFGTIRGAVRYSPRDDRPNTIAPKTHITAIRLFFDRIDSTSFAGELRPWYPLPNRLSLPYDQNHLSFDFVGISHRNPEGVLYRWKLEGFDEEWSPKTSQRSAVYSNIPPGAYTLHVVAYNEDGMGDPTPATFSFEIRPPFWSTAWFTALAVAGAGLAVGLIFRSRLNAVRRQSERERIELEMTRKIIELEGQSLRLSMNPHFIFNALNSIQAYIADRNPSVAKRYLSKFSRLMRSILENSRETSVTIERESTMLASYIELERLNMNDSFEYRIEIAPAIDPEQTGLPPMLIQPLVENAIHHGLRHREGGGRLTILFDITGELLHCSVVDNGVGRSAAERIERKDGRECASTALTVTRERLAIIGRQTGTDARLVVTDLHDEEGNPAGTSAEVFVPYVIL